MKIKRVFENRPWGMFEEFAKNKKCTVKIVTVKPGKRFSLQFHKKRDEFWVFLDNPAKVTVGSKVLRAKQGTRVFVPRHTKHRVQSLGKEVNFLEISFGSFSESDIIRLEDDFGRV